MKKNLTKFVVFSFLILFLLQHVTPLHFSYMLDDVPEEVKLYLGPGEEAEKAFRITYTPPSVNNIKREGVDLIFYIVKKGGLYTGEYIIWDNVLKSVVGGYKWYQNFGYQSYKTIISYIERDRIAKFIENVFTLTSEFKHEIKDLRNNSEKLMKDLKKEEKRWAIFVGTVTGIVVSVFTIGAILPLVLSVVVTISFSVWRYSELDNLVVEWDVKPQKYPEYFLTIVMLGQFSDQNSVENSADNLRKALKGVNVNDEISESLVNLHKESTKVLRGALPEIGKSFGETLLVDYFARFLGTSIPISIHVARGVLGNEKFYNIFTESFVEEVGDFSYRILGRQAELGVNKEVFMTTLKNVGKEVASSFRAKAVSGIPKDQILKSFKNYEKMLEKPFTKDALLKNFKGAVITAIAQITAEYLTENIVRSLQANLEEVAINGFIHAEVSIMLIDAIEEMKKEIERNDIFKNYALGTVGYWYADRVFSNYIEYWNITVTIFEKNQKLLNDNKLKEHLGNWFNSKCGSSSLSYPNILECGKNQVFKAYGNYKQVIEEFLELDKILSRLTDSYIANMSRRLANAIPKVTRQADIILTLDTSGSMGQEFLQKTKLDVLKDAVEHLINLFKITKGSIRVGIVTFSTTADLKINLTDDYDLLRNIVGKLVAGGSTAMGDALHISLKALLNQRNESFKAIILLTDGKSNTGRDPKDVLDKELVPSSIPVFTIGIGKGGVEYDAEILKKISDKTGGTFYEVDPTKGVEESELIKIFLRIGLSITAGGQKIKEEVVFLSQGEKARYNIDANDGKPFTVVALYHGSKVTLNLYTPLGELVTPSLKDIYMSSEGFEAWIIKSPEPGVWTAELIGEELSTITPVFLLVNKPAIEIEPEYVEVSFIHPDTQEIIFKVKSISSQPLRNLAISLWGNIEKIATIEPKIISVVSPSESRNVVLKITSPRVDGIYDGFIEFNDGWFTQRIPIKIIYKKLVLSMLTDKTSYFTDESIKIYVLVEDSEGERILDADVSLFIDSNLLAKPLDDGREPDEIANDGIYSSIIKPPLNPGDITVTALVTKHGYPTAYTSLKLRIEKTQNTVTTTITPFTTPTTIPAITITSYTSIIMPILITLTIIATILLLITVFYIMKKPVCPRCGTVVSSRRAKFCRKCGARLK